MSLRGPSQVGVFLPLPAWRLWAVDQQGLLGPLNCSPTRELAVGGAWEPEIAKNYGDSCVAIHPEPKGKELPGWGGLVRRGGEGVGWL